jgi:hypothetical protein
LLYASTVHSSISVHSQFQSAGKELWPFYIPVSEKKKTMSKIIATLFTHSFHSRNTIITVSRDKIVTLVTKLTIGTLVPLVTFITMITATTPMANLLAVQSKQSLFSLLFMWDDIKGNRYILHTSNSLQQRLNICIP